MKALFVLVMALLLVAAAACAPADPPLEALTPATGTPGSPAPPSEATATATAAATDTDAPVATGTAAAALTIVPPTTSVPADLLGLPEVDQAKADLAQRLSVALDAIVVVSVQRMAWSDTSMGCPDPGMSYLQVLIKGLFIQLGHAGQFYNYHSGGDQPPFLCALPLAVDQLPPTPAGTMLVPTPFGTVES